MDVDFGVEVTRSFESSGEVRAVEVPGGRAAVAVHIGSYAKLHDAHQALHRWCEGNQLRIGTHSWEIYGDWSDDESKLETTIVYLLA
jgi:effector-binding domain-containing protein